MKSLQIIIINVVVTVAACTVLLFVFEHKQKKIAVVDAVELFSKYNMKKELESMADMQARSIQRQLDSIGNLLRISVNLKNSVEQERLMSQHKSLQQYMEQEYARSNQYINETVWKRLNPVIEAFGKERKLQLIVGANGMGSVLYKDDYYDMTDEMIKYANDDYESK